MVTEVQTNITGEEALEKLRDDLRFPMADVRQILENYTVGNWKSVLVIGNPDEPGQSIMIMEEGLDGEGFVALVESAMGGTDHGVG